MIVPGDGLIEQGQRIAFGAETVGGGEIPGDAEEIDKTAFAFAERVETGERIDADALDTGLQGADGIPGQGGGGGGGGEDLIDGFGRCGTVERVGVHFVDGSFVTVG